MSKSKRSITDLLSSGKGARFKNITFNLLDEAEEISQKTEKNSESPLKQSTNNTQQSPNNHPTNTQQGIPKTESESLNKESITPPLAAKSEISPAARVVPSPLPTEEFELNTQQIPSKHPAITHQTSNKHPTNTQQSPNMMPEKLGQLKDLSKKIEKLTSSPPINDHPANTQQIPSNHPTDTQQKPNNSLTTPNNYPTQYPTNHPANYPTDTQRIPSKHPTNTRLSPALLTIVGLKKDILFFLYNSAKNHDDKVTDPVSITNLSICLQTTKKTVEVTLSRMIKEGIITIYDSRKGRGGWTMFQLPNSIFHDLFKAEAAGKLPTNTQQTPSKYPAQNPTKYPAQNPTEPSSSSSIFIKETTTEETPVSGKTVLPEEWAEIDYSCLAPYRFTENHLLQIYQCGKVTPDVAQQSIYELHHDLTVNNNSTLRNPRNVLLSLLKKGTPYTSPGYVSEDLLTEQKCLEELKRRNQELIQIREETERLKNLPTEIEKDTRFQNWVSSLTVAQKKQIAPHATTEGSTMQVGLLRAHWESQINPHTS